jgi:transposase
MAKGYSLDLRRRVFGAWQNGEGSQVQIAARFCVSVSFVRDMSRRFRQSGDVAAKPYGGGRAPSVNAAACEAIKAAVTARNDAAIQEHRQSLATAGYSMSRSVLGRALLKLGLTRKKRRSATMNETPSGFNSPARSLPGQ